MAADRHLRRLDRLCRDAANDLPWIDLATFIDALHEQYETFTAQIHRREIGAHVPISGRPQYRKRHERPACVCGHPFEGYHRTPGAECVEANECGCVTFHERPEGDA